MALFLTRQPSKIVPLWGVNYLVNLRAKGINVDTFYIYVQV